MANSGTTKKARQAAREAVSAAQEELARRTRANVDDLAKFFAATERIEAIDKSAQDRVVAIHAQAARQRDEQRQLAGAALLAMRDRGEDAAEIARLAGVEQKAVRELIKLVEQAPAAVPVPARVTSPSNGNEATATSARVAPGVSA